MKLRKRYLALIYIATCLILAILESRGMIHLKPYIVPFLVIFSTAQLLTSVPTVSHTYTSSRDQEQLANDQQGHPFVTLRWFLVLTVPLIVYVLFV